jgi:prepilin signal peptidase PulO-like enzyme (type II secretory pathway)
MVIMIALCGVLVGWFLNWLADYLPRFSASRPEKLCVAWPYPLATWQLLKMAWTRSVAWDRWSALRVGVELLSAFSLVYFWTQQAFTWTLLFHAAVYSFFLLIAIIDLKYRLVLNIVTYPAMAIALLVQTVVLHQNTVNVLLGGALAIAIFAFSAWLGDLGGGDIKLGTLIGAAFGFPQMLWALLLGAGVGAVAAAIMIVRFHPARVTIPYAPFLCLGAMLALLYNPGLFPA